MEKAHNQSLEVTQLADARSAPQLKRSRKLIKITNIMRRILIILWLTTYSSVESEIEVTFPVYENTKTFNSSTLSEALSLSFEEEDPMEPIYIDGILAYFSAYLGRIGDIQDSKTFDKLKEGMTLREIISLLGPGLRDKAAGVSGVYWNCEDCRVLVVYPIGGLDEVANYKIHLYRRDQRNEFVKQLAESLISSLEIEDDIVTVSLSSDTHQAKAGQKRSYRIGQTFQKTEPLPRIDFTITEIEENRVHCRYFFQNIPEGLLHYRESGKLIIHKREPVAGGDATR